MDSPAAGTSAMSRSAMASPPAWTSAALAMKAVDVDAPCDWADDWEMTDVMIGAATMTGHPNPFPLTSSLLLRFGAGGEPRFVRVDTEESYKGFRENNSPEMSELRARV